MDKDNSWNYHNLLISLKYIFYISSNKVTSFSCFILNMLFNIKIYVKIIIYN